MLEYIERESLVKDIKHYSHARIDNDAIDQMGFQFVEEIVSILRIIEKQPTADVVEVVRCKDCKNRRVDEEIINRQKAEIERLTAQRDKAVKDFEEFARIAFENPFACKYCAHSVENGRACLWKEEHEDEEETCSGKRFEYRKMVGKNND